MKLKLIFASLLLSLGMATTAMAADYVIDTSNHHAFIQFKVGHLGFSWIIGRFDDFTGTFSYDEKHPNKSKVSVKIDTASVDTNHAPRDKHLRSADFFNVEKYPTATFVSKSFRELGGGKAKLTGAFSLNGVTRDITIDVTEGGAGPDPWGGYRRGFEGRTTIRPEDYNIAFAKKLGPASANVELYFSFEGIRQG